MRVIGGKYRSRIIQAPTGYNTRPTMDKVKESMFNIIGNNIVNSVVLDLFSGSGSLGIESLSRGASYVYFNDHDFRAFNTIKGNLATLAIDKDSYSLNKLDYKAELNLIDKKLDIVLLDPPYKNKDIYMTTIDYLIKNNKLKDNYIIVCECDLDLENFSVQSLDPRVYKYGNKKLLVFSI